VTEKNRRTRLLNDECQAVFDYPAAIGNRIAKVAPWPRPALLTLSVPRAARRCGARWAGSGIVKHLRGIGMGVNRGGWLQTRAIIQSQHCPFSVAFLRYVVEKSYISVLQ
jgi:hypothetical protein